MNVNNETKINDTETLFFDINISLILRLIYLSVGQIKIELKISPLPPPFPEQKLAPLQEKITQWFVQQTIGQLSLYLDQSKIYKVNISQEDEKNSQSVGFVLGLHTH